MVAMGHLHALWHTAIEQAEDGDLSKWTAGSIADAAAWEGSEQEFLDASLRSGFMDEGQLLHDWLDYAGKYLTSKYKTSNRERLEEIWAKFGKKYGKEFLTTSFSPPKDRPHNLHNLTEPNKTQEHPWRVAPDFVEAWKSWEKSRKKKAGDRQFASLLKLSGSDMNHAIAILNQSADNQWQGIFPLKGKNGNQQSKSAGLGRLKGTMERLVQSSDRPPLLAG